MADSVLGKHARNEEQEDVVLEEPTLKQHRLLLLGPAHSLYAFCHSDAFKFCALWHSMQKTTHSDDGDDKPTELFTRAVTYYKRLLNTHFTGLMHALMLVHPADEELLKYMGDDRMLFIYQQGQKGLLSRPEHPMSMPSSNVFFNAADAAAVQACLEGRVDVLRLLTDTGYTPGRIMLAVVVPKVCDNGHLEILKWLSERHTSALDLSVVFRESLLKGQQAIAEWAWSQQTEDWRERMKGTQEQVFEHVCGGGHLETAQWMWRVLDVTQGDYAAANAFARALSLGGLPVVQWLAQIGDPNIPAKKDDSLVLEERTFWSTHGCAECPLKNGHVDVAQWIMEHYQLDTATVSTQEVFREVCRRGHLESAKFIRNHHPEAAQEPRFPQTLELDAKLAFLRWIFETYPHAKIQEDEYFQRDMEFDVLERAKAHDMNAVLRMHQVFKEHNMIMDCSIPFLGLLTRNQEAPLRMFLAYRELLTFTMDTKTIFAVGVAKCGFISWVLEFLPEVRKALQEDRTYMALCQVNTGLGARGIRETCRQFDEEAKQDKQVPTATNQ